MYSLKWQMPTRTASNSNSVSFHKKFLKNEFKSNAAALHIEFS